MFELSRLHVVTQYLFTRDPRISVCGRAKHKVVEDGSVRGDADAAAHHDSDLELVPVLVAAPERTLDFDLNDKGREIIF